MMMIVIVMMVALYTNDDDDAAEILLRTNGQGDSGSRIEFCQCPQKHAPGKKFWNTELFAKESISQIPAISKQN